jgi:hypothetical protein
MEKGYFLLSGSGLARYFFDMIYYGQNYFALHFQKGYIFFIRPDKQLVSALVCSPDQREQIKNQFTFC